ncbi:uncharacterized protein LOC126744301 isoform X3 [Anthonomus grandis grandis]|uniref:uncharacterized protein LOC126744301 isoform X3 n=1 Tax=Anthonomus grandis grandis TaxID=2921223 RepID=UPI002165487A|nr:uncharacterized protein LOC126744301 isoform X3 [Anthonomus grandis grandis]
MCVKAPFGCNQSLQETLQFLTFASKSSVINVTMGTPQALQQKCSVPECYSYGSDPEVFLYQFPKDKTLQNLWKAATKIQNKKIYRGKTVVCNKHFAESDFVSCLGLVTRAKETHLRLKRNVVPSRNLPEELAPKMIDEPSKMAQSTDESSRIPVADDKDSSVVPMCVDQVPIEAQDEHISNNEISAGDSLLDQKMPLSDNQEIPPDPCPLIEETPPIEPEKSRPDTEPPINTDPSQSIEADVVQEENEPILLNDKSELPEQDSTSFEPQTIIAHEPSPIKVPEPAVSLTCESMNELKQKSPGVEELCEPLLQDSLEIDPPEPSDQNGPSIQPSVDDPPQIEVSDQNGPSINGPSEPSVNDPELEVDALNQSGPPVSVPSVGTSPQVQPSRVENHNETLMNGLAEPKVLDTPQIDPNEFSDQNESSMNGLHEPMDTTQTDPSESSDQNELSTASVSEPSVHNLPKIDPEDQNEPSRTSEPLVDDPPQIEPPGPVGYDESPMGGCPDPFVDDPSQTNSSSPVGQKRTASSRLSECLLEDETPCAPTSPKKKLVVDQRTQTGPFQGPIPINFLDNLVAYDYQLACFTGISRQTLEIFSKALCDYTKFEPSPDITRRIIATMMKLKTNLSFQCLSVLFHQDLPTCKITFAETISVLAASLRDCVEWPHKKEIFGTAPNCFKRKISVSVMLECIELFVERPRIASKVKTYSNRHNRDGSIKIIVGFTTEGEVCYVSPVYCGMTKEEMIFIKENLLARFDPCDALMVDKGFFLEEHCHRKKISLLRAPVLQAKMNGIERELVGEYESTRGHVVKTLEQMRLFNVFSCRLNKELVGCMSHAALVIGVAVNMEMKQKRMF